MENKEVLAVQSNSKIEDRAKKGNFRYKASNLWLSRSLQLEELRDAFLEYDALVRGSGQSNEYYTFEDASSRSERLASFAVAKDKVNMAMGVAQLAAQATIPLITMQTHAGSVRAPLFSNWEMIYDDPYSNGRDFLMSPITRAIGHCWAMYEKELETDASFVGLLRGFVQLNSNLRQALGLKEGSAKAKGVSTVVFTFQTLFLSVSASLLATVIWELFKRIAITV